MNEIPTTAIIIEDGDHASDTLDRVFNYRPFVDHLMWLKSVHGRMVTSNTGQNYEWIKGACDEFSVPLVQTTGDWKSQDAVGMCDQWILIVNYFANNPNMAIFEPSCASWAAFKYSRNGWVIQIDPKRGRRRPRVNNIELIIV